EDGRIIVLRTGTLTLRAADVFDTGLYHCISTNNEDADTLTFRVTVVDPHLEHNSVNGAQLSTAVGTTLHLPCTSTAAPDAAVTWLLPDHTILHQSAGNKRIFDNGTLRIEGVTEQDRGYFQCIAANLYGVDLLVFQVLVRQDETTPKEKLGAVGEWEEGDGSGNALLGSAAAQTHPSATPTTLTAPPEPAASASSSRGTQSAQQRNSPRKTSRRPYRNRTGRRLRGHRRQFVSSGRRADPQRWAALLQKTKRNSTLTDKPAEVAMEPPIQVQKFSEVPGDEEETSGDLGSPEEEFMMPVTERAPVPALGGAIEQVITAEPKGPVSHTPARRTSLLVTEPVTPLLSPLPQSVSPGSRRPQTYPKPTDTWERSDLSQTSANGIKQSATSSGADGTSTLSPAGQRLVYSGQSNNQKLKSASTTPMAEATDTSKAVAPQNTPDKIRVLTESVDKGSTKTDHQVPVVTGSAPKPELGPINSHTVQKGGTPKPPLALTTTTQQKIRVLQDIPTHTPPFQQQKGRQRKIPGRRRIIRPGRIPVKGHRYNFGRPGSARGRTAVAAGVQLNMKSVPNIPTLNNFSSFINSFSPEAPLSSPSTMNTPLEYPVGTPQDTLVLKEEENKHSARQKEATTVTSVTTKGTATPCNPTKLLSFKPTVTSLVTPQSDTRITKSKVFRVGGRRGQRRKRPPKTSAPQRLAAAPSTAATPPVGTATPVVTAVTSPAVPPSLAAAKPLPGTVSMVSVTEMPALWIPDTPEPPQHMPMAATQTLVTPVTQRNTHSALSLPSIPTTQSPTLALQTTSVTPRSTQVTTAPPASPAQTPTMALQTPPWLDEPAGAVSAQPAAVGATSGSAPAQHIRATGTAGGESYLSLGESVTQESQAAQPTFPARTVPRAPAAVTDTAVPSSQPPPALP
ncbi:IGS10 protein, partial [Campylorhamphus procurvoides]|nr:IGS10 protein [Campylorhamphus procurvoides]